ncbi:LpqN/LpqT family lipoprotein [Nocardia jiangxiensis]|uniref:LpqN/LpqT family lipoprotein n=1 Tax=Nocardia jiangxiensis TaxID=282685 RepID=A0ABW6RSL2_9NOCA|nr:LpqN/LpqT family lipoprotein [Nocardia jiangxiensis]
MNAASQDQVPQAQDADEQTLLEQTLPTIGEFLAAVGATPVVVHPEYPGVPVVLLDIPGDWHEVVREVLPNAFGAWALPAEEGSVSQESGWVENAVLMAWRLSLPVDPRAVMRCAYTDSRRLPDWVELGGDVEDYDGFPSAEISGTYTYAGLSLWMSTRYLIASTPTGQYLLQLTVTTFADEIDEGVFIAESFSVQVPPARPGLGAHEQRPEPQTGPQPVVAEENSGFRSGMYEPDSESRWRQADSGVSAESFEPDEFARQGNSGFWSDAYDQRIESNARAADFGITPESFESEFESSTRRDDFGYESEPPLPLADTRPYEPESYAVESDFPVRSDAYEFEPASESSGGWDDSSVIGSNSARTGSHSVVQEFDSVVFEQEPSVGFDTPATGYESYGGHRDSLVREEESSDPAAYSAIMGIDPPPVDSDPRGPHRREPEAPSTGNMDFRI